MANLGGTFDATQVDPTNEFEPLPSGQYEAEIIDSRREPVSKEDHSRGECLALTWRVAAGPLHGRLFWHRLLLWYRGQNADKVLEIAQRQLSEICHAVGVMNTSDSEDLHYRRCLVRYGPQKKRPEYNEVKSVKALGGDGRTTPGQPATRPAFTPPQGQASAAPPPGHPGAAPSGGGWKRRTG